MDVNDPGATSGPAPLAVVNGKVVFMATDGSYGTELLEVQSTSQTAVPQIAAIPDQEATVGEPFQLAVGLYASDPNVPALPLTFSLGDDAQPGMTIDPNTGLLTWPASDDQTPGTYSFTVTVSDNSPTPLTASELVTLQVYPVDPPTLAEIPQQYIGVGHTFQLDVSQYASDPNFPPFPLTYSLVAGEFPTGATIDPNTGLLTWPTASNQAETTYSFTVMVADDSAPPLTMTEMFTVQVNSVEPPGIRPIPSQAVDLGNTLTLDMSQYAYDSSNPILPLTYSLNTGLPAGASINAATGAFTWTPSSNQPTGPQTFTLTVSDDSTPPQTATESFTVTVYPASSDLPPTLESFPGETVTVGETLTADLSEFASDPNTPPLSYTFSLGSDAPVGAAIDPITGVLTWATPSNEPTGPVTFTVIVTDDQTTPASSHEEITVNVDALAAPSVEIVPVQDATIGQAFTINLSHYALDPNFPAYSLNYSLVSGATADASLNPTTGVFSWTPTASDGRGRAGTTGTTRSRTMARRRSRPAGR